MTDFVTLEEIREAHDALPGIIRRTPIVPLARDTAEVGREHLFLKLENLQVISEDRSWQYFRLAQSSFDDN